MKRLTDRQRNVYLFVTSWQRDKGYPPTQAEIRDHFGYSSLNAVRSHLTLIERKGYLHLYAGKARGIQMSHTANEAPESEKTIPLLGRIAAGAPMWAEQNFEELLPIPPSFFGGGELFALHVVGDSMVQVGIMNGDVAIIRKQESVENGEIGAVLIDQEATLKRVYLSSDSLLLKAANPEVRDMLFDGSDFRSPRIMGRYLGIVRTARKWGGS